MATKTVMTLEQFMALPEEEPDGTRYELSEGELVTVSAHGPLHALVTSKIDFALRGALSEQEYLVFAGDAGFLLGSEPESATVRAADIAVIRRTALPKSWIQGGPVVAVEVLSPSTSAGDILLKVRQYMAAGSLEVWLVYPETRTVYVYSAGQRNPAVWEESDEFQSVVGARFRVADFFES